MEHVATRWSAQALRGPALGALAVASVVSFGHGLLSRGDLLVSPVQPEPAVALAAPAAIDGEAILRLALASRLMQMLPAKGAARAAALAVGQMARVGGEAGCIVMDAAGGSAFAHNSQHFAVACAREGEAPRTFLHQDEPGS